MYNLCGILTDYVHGPVMTGRPPLTFQIISMARVLNKQLQTRFASRKQELAAVCDGANTEAWGFHGCRPDHLPSIAKWGLLPKNHPLVPAGVVGTDEGWYGSAMTGNFKTSFVMKYTLTAKAS